jgi:serine phosphatase RsbU (regulator of sigma subunit)
VGIPYTLRTGRATLHPRITPEFIRARAANPRHAELLRSIGEHSKLVAPLSSRGRVLGALALVRLGGRRLDEHDLAVAEELSRRLGAAVDNARLYAERSYIARTLQESLLPAELPSIPFLETAARFHAAGEGNEVGGDFYDLFEAGGGRWSVVVGDVCGKGPDAAAVTALVRYTLRATAMREPGPAAGLRVLNEALLRQRGDLRFATVAYTSLVPTRDGARLEVASAGHPLPLVLRRDGSVEPVGKAGTLVGVIPNPDLSDASVQLAEGDSLVLYTDGVVEARNDEGFLEESRLRELLAGCKGLPPERIAARIESTAVELQQGDLRDDIAVVVLRVLRVLRDGGDMPKG